MEIRIATLDDWEMLSVFYHKIYRENHPLQHKEFWKWQFGNPEYGNAIIAISDNKIAAHLGVSIADGYAWHINLFVLEEWRNVPVLPALIKKADAFGKPGNLSANRDAVNLYRSLKWYQYANLERRICVRHDLADAAIQNILLPVSTDEKILSPEGHFWQQPGLEPAIFEDGSTAILQKNVGGVRFVSINDIKKAAAQCFDMGFHWCDYVTSFNNPILRKLERNHWKDETEQQIPWLLNPVVHHSKSNLTFLTQEPIPIDFYINRLHSDLGRIGSLPKE
ncbi:hypothetical protein [Flavobacterium pallidum]|uniref:N-acetyltransferase domain-containing protein n=1 Tax=Flavobacterium pallidum TaxID=2172098 RepID=A0A2S1SH14_9FLAO|nr:hypothetical protein [Flavobacterium pallidum]AWI25671.1 hypothetical protein HYN49_07030 [Flavobacterium pallidum]